MEDSPDFASPDEERSILSRIIYPQMVIGSLLGIALIGFGYVAYITFPRPVAYLYLALAFLYTIVSGWILHNLQKHIADSDVDEGIESKHFLCANPICARCGGYYGGLTATAGTGLELRERLVTLLKQSGIDPWIAILAGFGLFVFTSPFHGALKSVMRNLLSESSFEKSLESNRLKFLIGFASGLSLILTLVGLLVVLPE